MAMPKGRWAPCTPEWVAEYNACGATVRRPILRKMWESGGAPVYRGEGHEHLMVVFQYSGHMSPMPHESGEPA